MNAQYSVMALLFFSVMTAPASAKEGSKCPSLQEMSGGAWYILAAPNCVQAVDIDSTHQTLKPAQLLEVESKCKCTGDADENKSLVIDCLKSPLNTSVVYFRTKEKCEGFIKHIGNEETIVAANESLKSKQKAQWIIDPKGKCVRAEGNMSMPRITMDNPRCFINTSIDLVDGVEMLDCTRNQNGFNQRLLFADSLAVCREGLARFSGVQGAEQNKQASTAEKRSPSNKKSGSRSIDESCVELTSQFGNDSQLTSVQKEENWKDFGGKTFKWSLQLISAEPDPSGGFAVTFVCLPPTHPAAFVDMQYPAKAKSKVLQFIKGVPIEVSGTLKEFHPAPPDVADQVSVKFIASPK